MAVERTLSIVKPAASGDATIRANFAETVDENSVRGAETMTRERASSYRPDQIFPRTR